MRANWTTLAYLVLGLLNSSLLHITLGSSVLHTHVAATFNAVPISSINDDDTCEPVPDPPPEEDEPEQELLELLNQGSEHLSNYSFTNEAIFALGNTGSGKSTVTQILAGNLSRLYAVEAPGDRLVIIDEDQRIGLPSTKSKTLIPELITKQEENKLDVYFYDNPGFDDTRGADIDIATNFFINQVTSTKIGSLKLLFLVIHSSVKLGNDRIDFDLLAKHASTFVKNLSKYKKSFFLVVNKVDSYNSRGQYIEDYKIMEEVGAFLSDYNRTLYSKLDTGSPEEQEMTRRKIVFVETLLETNESTGNLTKIWFVRSPLDCGRLSESEMMLQTRSNLTALYESLEYTTVDIDNDFGFTLKPETLDKIDNYTTFLNEDIYSSVNIVVKNLNQNYNRTINKQLESNFFELEPFVAKLENQTYQVKTRVESLKLTTNSVEFVKDSKLLWDNVGHHLSSKFVDFMIAQEEYFVFFEKVTGRYQPRNTSVWIEPVERFYDLILADTDWFRFCQQLSNHMESYEYHRIRDTKPIKEKDQPWLDYISNNIFLVSDRIKELSKRISTLKTNIVDNIMEFTTNPLAYNQEEAENKLFFSQNFVRMQDVLREFNRIASAEEQPLVYIYAAHTVFLDVNITADMSVAMLAPNWVNPSSEQFTLSLIGSTFEYPTRANDGSEGTGQNGANGCAGKPGNPGGSFLGITNQVLSSQPVQIISVAGNGAKGQAGGNGGTGTEHNAKNPQQYPSSADPPNFCEKYPAYDYPIACCNYGYNGGNGGKGGNGGVGGKPGNLGILSLIQIQNENETNVLLSKESGTSGSGGSGGSGSRGGRRGNGYFCKYPPLVTRLTCESRNPSSDKISGKDGVAGQSSVSNECTKPVPNALDIVAWSALLGYKLANGIQSHSVYTNFSKKIGDSAKHMYTLEGFLDELLYLEQLRINETIKSKFFLGEMYESFISRLEVHCRDNCEGYTKEQQKLVYMLLTSSYNSLMTLSPSSGLGVIFDISRYFYLVKQQIEILQSIEKSEQLKTEIQKVKQDFQNDLSRKMEQTLAYVEELVVPAIREADKEIEGRLNETQSLLEDLIEDAELSLEDCKKRLQEEEKRQKRMKWLKIWGALVEIVAPLDPTGVVSSYSTMLNKLNDKYGGNPDDLERLRELVKEAEALVEDLEEKRAFMVEEFLPVVETFVEYINNMSKSLSEGEDISAPQLGIAQWQVTEKFKDCQSLLEGFKDDSIVVYPLVRAFDRIHDAMTMMISLYEMVEEYMDTKSLATYIGNLHSAGLGDVNVTDPKFAEYVRSFETKLRENLLNEEIKKAMHAFKQWVFPFAKFYLYAPNALISRDIATTDGVGDEQIRQIENLSLELERYQTGIVGNIDTFIIQTNFSSGTKTTKPFYTWTNANWKSSIQKLISGQKVEFNADVREQGFPGWEAIKFKLIEINFKLNRASDEMQEEFDDVLEYFGVTMMHSGVSYYRFQEDYYKITGTNQTLRYNYETDANGNRLGTNQVYEKFKKGEFVLSPFTVWTFQLLHQIPTTRQQRGKSLKQIGFGDLEKFLPYMDLELVGIGSFVDGQEALNEAKGDMMLDKYYERDDRFRLEIG